MKRAMKRKAQSGVFLIEALIAILIFSLGILGMVAMGGSAIAAQSDAQFRTEAANFASEMAANIALNVDRTSPALLTSSLQSFSHRPAGGGSFCTFAGATSTNPLVTATNAWTDRMHGVAPNVLGLPGSSDTHESILVDTSQVNTGFNKVTITVCWKPPATSATLAPWHRHVLVTYVTQ